jgi:uncharacterized protein (TIGR00297 family)
VTAYSETHRQIVHVAMAGFALLLRYTTWQQAAGLAVVALIFNLLALPALAPRIMRATDRRGARAGVLYYPLAVLVLILVFRTRLDIVAAAWGVLAFGDGFATLAGTIIGGRRLPWNPNKTWAGLMAFILAGAAGAVALSAWVSRAMSPTPPVAFIVIAPIAAAIIAALIETVPIELDDNISVPAAAGAVLWFSSQINMLAFDPGGLAEGLVISFVIAVVAWKGGAVTTAGARIGFLFAVIVYAAAYLAGLAVLGTALVLTLVSSRLGRARKTALGIAEGREGRRGAGNIIANCLVGTCGAALALFSDAWSAELGYIMMIAGLAAGASDTVASEIGKAFGGQPRAFPSFRAAPPGTPGAVSVVGTLAGVAAAFVIAAPAVALWLVTADRLPGIVAGCTAGAFAESALASRFEATNVLDNNTLNLLNTAIAAAIAVTWYS